MTAHEAGWYPERWEPVPEIDGCTYSRYRASTTGNARSLDRGTRRGTVLKATPGSGGYVRVKMSCDNPDHEPHTLTMQKIVLHTFAGPCPPGMEARHLDNDPANNRWAPGGEEETRAAGGNLIWGTKLQNHYDKADPDAPPEPVYPCKNAADGCTGKAYREGRRCLGCVAADGRKAADMLRAKQPLHAVAEHLGYSPDWTFKLAEKYGGLTGLSRAEARTQRPPLPGWRGRVARLIGAR